METYPLCYVSGPTLPAAMHYLDTLTEKLAGICERHEHTGEMPSNTFINRDSFHAQLRAVLEREVAAGCLRYNSLYLCNDDRESDVLDYRDSVTELGLK
jgi:hypothetical protein